MKRFKNVYLDEIHKRLPGDMGSKVLQTTPDDLYYTLSDLGFDLSGTGSWGSVYTHPTQFFAIKIFEVSDTAYLAWINFCKKHSDQPLLPKFRGGVHLLHTAEQDMYAVRVEKLRKPDKPAEFQKIVELRNAMISIAIRQRVSKTVTQLEMVTKNINDAIKEHSPFLKKIVAYATNVGYQDFNPDNFMFRGNQIVITDPMKGFGRTDKAIALHTKFAREDVRNFLRQGVKTIDHI